MSVRRRRTHRLLIQQDACRPYPLVKKTIAAGTIISQHPCQSETAHKLGRQSDNRCITGTFTQRPEKIADDTLEIAARTAFGRAKTRTQLRISSRDSP